MHFKGNLMKVFFLFVNFSKIYLAMLGLSKLLVMIPAPSITILVIKAIEGRGRRCKHNGDQRE